MLPAQTDTDKKLTIKMPPLHPLKPTWHQLLGKLRDASESEEAWAMLNEDFKKGHLDGKTNMYSKLFNYMEDDPSKYKVWQIWEACAVDPDQLPEPEQDDQMDWLWSTFFPLDMTELLVLAKKCPALLYHALHQNKTAFNIVKEDLATASTEEASEFKTILKEWFESQEGVDCDEFLVEMLGLEVD